jgi:CIC family chloride channel protein
LDFTSFKRVLPTTVVRELWRMMALCAVVGVVAGLGAIAFYALLDVSRWFFTEYAIGIHPIPPGGETPLIAPPEVEFRRWMLWIVPALGGLLSGLLVYSLAPEAEGHGTDAAIDAYHNHAGRIRKRVPFIKAIASALTIGTGGSAGREGPIAQIGAGFGSMFGTWLKLRPHERRVLMGAGMGAGIGAIFHAPLAGALFAAEVLYRELDLEYEVIIPAVISSIIAYAIFAMQFGWEPLFVTPGFEFRNPAELLPYFILALAVAAGATLFIKFFYAVRDLFRRIPRVPSHVKPAIGGLLIGGIAFFLPESLGTGYGIVQQALLGQTGAGMLLILAAAKIVTTSLTIGSGGSGGVFGPAVVIGGALGGGVGLLMQQLFPGMDLQPGAFALVGMAGFFAAAANTPLSTIIMVSEMTGNYHLLVPSMWVCVIGFMLCKRWSIYEKQLGSRFDAPVHTGNMLKAVLKQLPVRDVVARKRDEDLIVVHEDTDLRSMADRFFRSDRGSFPVVDRAGRLIGMIGGRELRTVIGQDELQHLIVAADLAHQPVLVTTEDDLLKVMRLMAYHRLDELIVVDPDHPSVPKQMISRSDVVHAYQEALFSSRPAG